MRAFLWGAIALIAGFALLVPTFLSESRISLAAVIVIFAIVGVSLVVLTGWAGQVSLGQVAFMGIGGAMIARYLLLQLCIGLRINLPKRGSNDRDRSATRSDRRIVCGSVHPFG